MVDLLHTLIERPNFVVFVILFLWGIYIMLAHPNLVKKLIGLYITQTSVILFLVAFSAKDGATVPVILDSVMQLGQLPTPEQYANPLPHVLTVTAIVVQVATLGVSLALVAGIYKRYGTLDEDAVLEQLK